MEPLKVNGDLKEDVRNKEGCFKGDGSLDKDVKTYWRDYWQETFFITKTWFDSMGLKPSSN